MQVFWTFLLWILAGLVVLNFLINILKKYFLSRQLNLYRRWVEDPSQTELYTKLMEHAHRVVELFKKAKIEDSEVADVEPLGYGQGAFIRGSVFQSYPSRHQRIIEPTLRKFHMSIGVYRSRALQSFNPLHWCEKLLSTPKSLFDYLADLIIKFIKQ